jgi:hypothetical protein
MIIEAAIFPARRRPHAFDNGARHATAPKPVLDASAAVPAFAQQRGRLA